MYQNAKELCRKNFYIKYFIRNTYFTLPGNISLVPQDGLSDHVGIVQKVENGIVYTVEGNSGDSYRVNQYSVGHYEILGYGVPQY